MYSRILSTLTTSEIDLGCYGNMYSIPGTCSNDCTVQFLQVYIIVRHCLEGFYICDLEDQRTLCRIPSEVRVLLSPEGI